MRSVEISAKTRKEAIDRALGELGVELHEVEIEIMDEGSRGLFGIGARDVRVRVSTEAIPDRSSAERDADGDWKDIIRGRESRSEGRRGERPPRSGRQERPERRERERPARHDRKEGQEREPRVARGDRDERPARESRGDREDRPARENRGDREERPAREGRGDRGERPSREGRGGRDDRGGRGRPDRGSRQGRDRDQRDAREPRSDRGERSDRDRDRDRGEQRNRDRDDRGGRRDRERPDRPDRPERREPREERGPRHERRERETARVAPDTSNTDEFDENDAMAEEAEAQPRRVREPEDPAVREARCREAASLLQEVIDLMGITATVAGEVGEEDTLVLKVSSEDSAILIGRKGRTLSAMQFIINRMISAGEGGDLPDRIVVDVEGYLDRRRESLEDMAIHLAEKAKQTGRNMRVKPLNPQERRIIHVKLQDDPDVRTFSLGDTLYRSVIIAPKGGEDDERPRRGRGGRGGRGRGGRYRDREELNREPEAAPVEREPAPVESETHDHSAADED